MGLTDAEKFVKSLGDVANSINPELLKEDSKMATREFLSLGGKILSTMTFGQDKYGLGKIDFESFKKAYAEVKAKAGRP